MAKKKATESVAASAAIHQPLSVVVPYDYQIPASLQRFFIKVHLRIVGIYFKKTVLVPITGTRRDVAVQDVLDAYVSENGQINQPGGLAYVTQTLSNPERLSILSFIYNFEGGVALSGINRQPGLYSLTESSLDDNQVALGWQYYVIDGQTNVNKSKTRIGEGLMYFAERPTGYNLRDGDTVIWRLVTIARVPNFPDPLSVSKHYV